MLSTGAPRYPMTCHIDAPSLDRHCRLIYDREAIERAAKKHRSAALMSEAQFIWQGNLPFRFLKSYHARYSQKIFVGGLPWDATRSDLQEAFGSFGLSQIEFPVRSNASTASTGFVYLIFENSENVRSLLKRCICDNRKRSHAFYYKLSTERSHNKEVQIIPWLLSDNNYFHFKVNQEDLDPKKTVFVGNLHGTMRASDLAYLLEQIFRGPVDYAGIDIDKYKYPIGSGRATFRQKDSFDLAVETAFVDVRTDRFSKRIQLDPYLEDVECSECGVGQGMYFCRDRACFNYFCASCWMHRHKFDVLHKHKPMMRKKEEQCSTEF